MAGRRQVPHRQRGGAIASVLFGLALLAAGVWWLLSNETTGYRSARLLDAAPASVDAPDPRRDGDVVHVHGELVPAEPAVDPDLGVRAPALVLRREVEMRQWRERRRGDDPPRYEAVWSERAIDSSRFTDAEGHANPPMPMTSARFVAGDPRIGALRIDDAFVASLRGRERLSPSQVELPPNLAATLRASGDYLTSSVDPANPQVGDVRIAWRYRPAGEVSLIGVLRGDRIEPLRDDEGDALAIVRRGDVAAGRLLASHGERSARRLWVMRVVGTLLLWGGFALLLKPLAAVAGAITPFGGVARLGMGVVAGVLALLLSAAVIGTGWLWQRPWLLALLVVAVVAAVVWLSRRRGTLKATPPPPPPA